MIVARLISPLARLARHTLPPYWVDTVDEINANLEQITNKMEQLEAQRTYLGKLQRKKKETEGEGFGSGGLEAAEIDPGFSEHQQEMIRANVEDIDQRDKEIMEIAKSIEDLAIVFKELAVLVIDQGTILDRIDYNMEVAVDRVDEGVVQLEKARKYQKASRPMKCICFLVMVIIVLTIMLIIKYQPKDSGSGAKTGSAGVNGRMLLVMD
eukprot:g2061.t1